ncbi:hypothetical protein A0256_23810 [Mucilaginibacter sp. PAMC 26640]|nr:hypothetical protein A0256_23810 [Mucilaginibacter sp. PAMC 26640]
MTGINKIFDDLKICVIIPRYINTETLALLLADVSAYTSNVFVAISGLTTEMAGVLNAYPFVKIVDCAENADKGLALRKSFKHALALHFEFAICLDADGQYFAKDIPAFVEKLETVRNAIIIGSRFTGQTDTGSKTNFSHKLASFWFKVATGVACSDTQSGFCLYPLYLMKNRKYVTNGDEFQWELLIRAAWGGIRIDSVPVVYAPKEIKSNLRLVVNQIRLNMLNLLAVLIAFVYIKPRNFFRLIFVEKKAKELLKQHLFNFNQSPALKATSVGVGVFMGIAPIWGFQMITGLLFAAIFRLNKPLVAIASHISIPPMIPLVIFLSFKAGQIWMGEKAASMAFIPKISLESMKEHTQQYLIGSITLAIAAGLLATLITFILLKIFNKKAGSADLN